MRKYVKTIFWNMAAFTLLTFLAEYGCRKYCDVYRSNFEKLSYEDVYKSELKDFRQPSGLEFAAGGGSRS